MRSRKISLGLAVIAAMSLPACASGPGSTSASKDLLTEIKQSKVVTIGTSNDEPWSAVKDGKAEGIIPELIREYLKRKGIEAKVQPVPMPFDSLIPALTSGRIQVMGDAMYRTPEREKHVAFTDVLFYNTEGLAVAKGNPLGIQNLTGLCGHTGATYKGTVWAESLKKASATCPNGKQITVKVYGTIYEAFQDIQTGRVQGVLADASIAALAIKQNPNLKMELSTGYAPVDKQDSDNALAVAPQNRAFVDDFSAVFKEMKADGTVKRIFEDAGLSPADTWLEL
ncbi:substrate-binding periplasmic protein [Micromonospora eburnea]|uniref:Polar amino acid transport system substrate-binding protein n=1 Tax=Micromonospora eburnea TaxID=227316 RepID=A0A1C6UWC7_9ACTN|nr:transporter substrate-binding domain-containing protein [Micromonospora eburnea]SCL58320.1 polar amino acid transport system substrate-binding protein [Micromonospora eburnea]